MTQTVGSDAFVGTNYSDLHNHTAEQGGKWVRHPATSTSRFYLYSGKVYAGAVSGSAGACFYLPVVPFSADYSVFCDYNVKTMTGHMGLAGRIHATNNTHYLIYADPANVWVLAKRVNGVLTVLNNSINTDGAGTYELELRMTGTTIAWYVDGVLIGDETDSSITAAGYGGLRAGSASTATTGKHVDNFTIVDGSTAPVARSSVVGLIGL
jgi:hypothetical protein